MSYFKAKMHQIRFRLALRPRPCWGSLQGREGEERQGKGRKKEGRRKGERGREGRGRIEESWYPHFWMKVTPPRKRKMRTW